MQSSTKTERSTGFVNNIAGNLRALAEAWVFGEERQATTSEPTPCNPGRLIALSKQDCEYLGWCPASVRRTRPGQPISWIAAVAVLQRLDALEGVDTWKTREAKASVCPECGDTPDDTCADCDEHRPQGLREQVYEALAAEPETRHARLVRLARRTVQAYQAPGQSDWQAPAQAGLALARAVLAE